MQVNRPMKIRSGPYTEHDPAIPARSAVPPEDILYRINPRIRMRPESFGIIILTDGNKYVSVMPGAYALIQHLKKCGDFRIEDLKDTVETDEHLSTFPPIRHGEMFTVRRYRIVVGIKFWRRHRVRIARVGVDRDAIALHLNT